MNDTLLPALPIKVSGRPRGTCGRSRGTLRDELSTLGHPVGPPQRRATFASGKEIHNQGDDPVWGRSHIHSAQAAVDEGRQLVVFHEVDDVERHRFAKIFGPLGISMRTFRIRRVLAESD